MDPFQVGDGRREGVTVKSFLFETKTLIVPYLTKRNEGEDR